MASHDAKRGKLRAISQDNTAGVQKLNEELRKLKQCIDREHSNKNRVDKASLRKPKS